ncbi:DUF4222 domain-containing protein [Buttiauxella agrestis]
MKKKINQAQSEGVAQPEIRPGDIYKDRYGEQVTVKNVSHNRIFFIREGYSSECVFPAARFESEFTFLKKQKIYEWHSENNPLEKTKKLRELIQAGRNKK